MHLKMSSDEVVCCKKLPNITDELSTEANGVDPEQTAPIGAVWSRSTLFAIEVTEIFQQTRKADNFCCDWRIKGKLMHHYDQFASSGVTVWPWSLDLNGLYKGSNGLSHYRIVEQFTFKRVKYKS